MNKLITKLVNDIYNKYGRYTLFREYDYKQITVDNLTAFYRVQSAINYPYIYEIQIKIFDKVLYKPRLLGSKKCMYCNKKGASYKFKCCNSYTHFDCANDNKFVCCHMNSYLCSSQKDMCTVCLDETNTITQCGHHLCVDCLGTMYKHDKNRDTTLLCPYCRTIILEERRKSDYVNVKLDNQEEIVYLSYI